MKVRYKTMTGAVVMSVIFSVSQWLLVQKSFVDHTYLKVEATLAADKRSIVLVKATVKPRVKVQKEDI